MKEREILQILQTATISAVAASIAPAMKIKMIGRTFEPPAGENWLEIVYIPNNVRSEFWGSGKTYRGLYRLILHAALKDEGAYPAVDVIASISSYFTKDKVFQSGGVSVKIYEEPDLTGAIEVAPEMLFPVTIRYMSFQS